MFGVFLCIIVGYWILLSLFAFYNVKKILQFYKKTPQIEIQQNWKGFIRSDLHKWNQKQILFGCFTKFPLNVTALGFFLISFIVLIPISRIFGRKGKQYLCRFENWYGNMAIKIAFDIKEQNIHKNCNIETPIVISNHINWFDIWYIGIRFLPMSIVAKDIIKSTPIVRTIANFFDTIYVQRNSQNKRDEVIIKIKQRIDKFNQYKSDPKRKQRVNPLIIFPEGTTSNGRSILTFKIGAFTNLSPITLFALKYQCKQFQMGMGDILQSHHVMINLCLKPTLKIKHKIMYPLQDQSAQQYCNRCRQQYHIMTGFEKVECGYRDCLEYQKAMNEARKANKKNKQQKKLTKRNSNQNKKVV